MRLPRPIGLVAFAALAACSPKETAKPPPPPKLAPAGPIAPQAATTTPVTAETPAPPQAVAPITDPGPIATAQDLSTAPQAVAINTASWPPAASDADARRNTLVRAEVLLARAHFSPGVIDGRDGGNLKAALAAFEASRNLPADGKLSAAAWQALTQDTAPAIARYQIAPADVAGPFTPVIPTDYAQMAKLDRLGFANPLEALAEKFHMDQALLKALNPGVDFTQAGAEILVAQAGGDALPVRVAAIEVDKTKNQVRAYAADGSLAAVFPATVGSTERPAPSGVFKVTGIARNPTYTYDPARLTFGDRSQGKLTIKPGPNNPVGVVWIDLSAPTYGIHGTPDPKLVGKTASHGCVRLTNWDALALASAVKPGVKVSFVGVEQKARTPG